MINNVKYDKYEELLRDWTQKFNLIAPSTISDIKKRHIEDSLQLTKYIPKNVSIIDMGSGAGFPGIVLAIEGWKVTCIESIKKKAVFLNEVKKQLNLQNLTIINDRLENFLLKTPVNTGNFIFTARAFASLTKILDYTHKYKPRLFLLKGREIDTEISEALKHYKFIYKTIPSITGDGFVTIIKNIH